MVLAQHSHLTTQESTNEAKSQQKLNEILVFVLVLVREENRHRVETTLLSTLAVQKGKSLLPVRGHFFIPVVNTPVLKESFYRGCQLHIT